MFKRLFLPYLIGLLALVGVGLLLYPIAANWFHQLDQSRVMKNYVEEIGSLQPDKDEQLAAAHSYNEALSSGAQLDSWANVASGTGSLVGKAGEEIWPYQKLLRSDEDGVMGRIKIAKIDVDLPIYHGTDEDTLLKAAGHLEGTSLPVGGASTRAVITAHRGLASAKLFTDLDKLGVGDEFVIEVFDDAYAYKIIETKVVAPEETEELRAVKDKDLASLVTCTPLGINSHRILVTGERIFPTPKDAQDEAGKPSDLPHFPWWAVGAAAALLLIGTFVTRETLLAWGAAKRAKRQDSEKPQCGPRRAI